jgi:hypothetical protein
MVSNRNCLNVTPTEKKKGYLYIRFMDDFISSTLRDEVLNTFNEFCVVI